MKLYIIIALIEAFLASALAQIFSTYNLISAPALDPRPPPPPAAAVLPQKESYAHPEVVRNAIAESQLPPHIQNPFYKNPALAAALAEESWFKNKESPVFHRDADDVSRAEIFKIFKRAGWIKRR